MIEKDGVKWIPLSGLLRDREILENVSFYTLLKLCKDLTRLFFERRKAGQYLLYSDENKVLCDLENGGIDPESISCSYDLSEGKKETVSVKYIAPEILRGGEKVEAYRCSLYTLAVLLFRILTLSFPFEGRLWEKVDAGSYEAVLQFYRARPGYIFSETNRENRAVFGGNDDAIAYFQVYPEEVKAMFCRVFDEEGDRPAEEDWNETFEKMLARLTLCSNCGAEVFASKMKNSGERCWRCRKNILPYIIRVTEGEVVKWNKVVVPDLVYEGEGYRLMTVVKGTKWGIKNPTELVWRWTKSSGKLVTVECNKAVPVVEGMKLTLKPGVKAEIRVGQENDNGGDGR